MADKAVVDWNKYKYVDLHTVDQNTKNLGILVDQQMAALDPTIIQNYDSLFKKFPSQSKDYLLSAAKIGLNADTKGIDKLSAHDGIAQLKQDLTNYDGIKNKSIMDRNFAENMFGLLKGTSRTVFATLQAPYQYATTVGRDLYARAKGEIGTGQLVKDLNITNLVGETTNLGQLMRSTAGLATGKGPVDTGSGYFVSPDKAVGKAQAAAMSAYGRVNGKSFTLGRGAMSTLGVDPNSTTYRVMSGIVDGTLNVASDPTTWFGPGSATAIIRGGKNLKTAKTAAQSAVKLKQEAEAAAQIENVKGLNKIRDKKVKQASGEAKSIRRNAENGYLKAELDIQQKNLSQAAAVTTRLEKALDFTLNSEGVYENAAIEGSKTVAKLISDGSIGDFVLKNIAEQKPEGLIGSISQLEADYINTNKAFTGIYFNEVPEAGKLHIGAFDGGEYVATVSGKKPLIINDITKTYKNSTKAERIAEYTNREALFNQLYKFTEDPAIPEVTRKAIDEFIGNTPNTTNALKATAEDMLFGPGSESLAKLIARAAALKNEHLMQYLTEAIQTTYKADGFTNIRAIHGGIGGTVITQGAKIGARRVGITDTLTKVTDGTAAVGDELGANLISSIKTYQQSVSDGKAAIASAAATRAGIYDKIAQTNVLRDYAANDPDLIAKIINDPENIGIAKLMNLDMDIADTQYTAEFIKSEVGLTDGFAGAAKGDVDKAARYLLGKDFDVIAGIVASETNFSKLHRLFGRKLDVEMTQELVAATTKDEVLSIFLKHLAATTSDPKIYRSLLLKGQVASMPKNPLFKVVAPVLAQPLKWVEQSERYFGRYFTRSVVLPLDDLDKLTNGLEDWMSSAKIPNDMIEKTINALIAAPTPEQRGSVIRTALKTTHENLAEKFAPGDTKVKEILADALKVVARENAFIKNYHTTKMPYGETVSLDGVFINGQVTKHQFTGEQAIFEHQFIDDVIRLPDTKDIIKLINQYNKNKVLGKGLNAANIFSNELGDRWRTAQLAFRAAYIVRNVGEMQFRQYFSGHDSLFNHPLGYMAMIAANPDGTAMQKTLSQIAKYGNDVLGNKLVGKDAKLNQGISETVEEHFNFLARNHNSHDARFAFVGKIFEVIGIDSDRYHLGLSNTLMRARTDKLLPIVAGTAVDQEDQVVRELIEGNGRYKDTLANLINGGRNGVETAEFAKLFLKDTKNIGSKDFPRYNLSPDNIIPENIKIYLFDKNSTGSAARYVNNIVGTGPKALLMRELLANGEVVVNGTTIKIPRYGELKNVNEMADLETSFKAQLSRHFPKDEMTDSTVISARDKRYGSKEQKFFDAAAEKFFDISTKIENVVNFAPEFRMSYWDHVGRYVGMVNDNVLETLRVNAVKSLAPLTVGGKSISLKRHPSLRAINKEIAYRKSGKSKSITDGIDLETMNSMAAKQASKYTKELFYDASKQRQTANAMRILFPFAQAQFNTINQWRKLVIDSRGVQFYKLGKGYNALNQEGSNAIYDLTNTKYDAGQGFIYTNEFGEKTFRYPLAGTILGAMTGKNLSSAVQITAPVQSLNLAFGAVNPVIPGVGPMGQMIYAATGKSHAFGPVWDAINNIIFPFGQPKNVGEFLLPSYLNKTILTVLNDDTQIERGVKDWASYLASTGEYGDNPLADDTARNKLFNDARGMSKAIGLMNALFQSIAPATPSQEVFAKDKDGKLMTQTALYSAFDQISKTHPGDYFASVGEYADTFGIKNLLVIQGGSTRSVRGTKDAWSFLNNNPDIADEYVGGKADIVPYFFPGGEGAVAYYNYQKATGGRRILRPEELSQNAENLVYQMALSQVSNEQATFGYSDVWRNQKVIELNDKFGGNAPVVSSDINVAEEKVSMIAKALQEPAFQQSPNYKEAKQFYDAFQEVYQMLQQVRTTPNPKLGGGSWLAKQEAERLDNLATQLMIQNPAFAPMYYGVFSSLLKIRD